MIKQNKNESRFAVCINNKDYPASLELHKIYRVLPDEDAEKDGDLRIIDESGEDYLFSSERFVLLKVPQVVEMSLLKAA
ncbi:MAG: hypothetical protein ACR2F2_06790 [Pyrinomonadaceae bacterium]